MKIEGNFAEVERLLALAIPKRAKAGLRKGSRIGAKMLAARLKAAVPKETGRAQREVKVRAMKRSRVRVGATVRVWVRTGVPYYSFRDLGTVKLEGGRYFDRTAKAGGDQALREMADAVLQELSK